MIKQCEIPNSYRVSVADSRDVLARRPILHCKRSFVDHLAGRGCDHVASQKPVCLLVTQYLHQSIDLGVCSCTAVSGERELSNLVSNALKSDNRFEFQSGQLLLICMLRKHNKRKPFVLNRSFHSSPIIITVKLFFFLGGGGGGTDQVFKKR